MKAFGIVLILAFFSTHYFSYAQIPRTLSYQGVLADTGGTPKPDGTYNFTFRLYAVSSGGTAIWSETKSAQVKHGLFSTVLGTVTPIPDSVKFDRQYWLGVQVASDPELSPRMQLSSVGSSINSLRADVAQTVPDGSINAGKIASGQVVKSINNLHDNLTIRGANGAAVTTNGDTITVTASGGGGGGISAIQNTDNALSITNPGGPTTTVNVKIPFTVNGNMGVGTTSPVSRLHVSSSPGTLPPRLESPGATGANGFMSGWDFYHGGTGKGYVGVPDVNASFGAGELMLFGGNNTKTSIWAGSQRSITVDLNANVGIGTITPDQKLTVGGGTVADTKIKVDAGGNTYAGLQLKNSSRRWNWQVVPSNDVPGGRLRLTEEVANAEWMTITAAGNVGIGVANPTVAKLQVEGGTGSSSVVGVYAHSYDDVAVAGSSNNKFGVYGSTTIGVGVRARTGNVNGYAIFADDTEVNGISCGMIWGGYALYADGPARINGTTFLEGTVYADTNVVVFGDLSVYGGKNFRIDHPLDPANKTLTHSCIESNERLLVYSGTAVTDMGGDAMIQLPSYFEALNINYRYQLTIVGEEFAQSRVSKEVNNNQFSIKTDKPHIKVCWQVTGDRNDAYTKAHPFVVEEEKKPEDRGKYFVPELFGQPKEMGIGYRPRPAHQQIDQASPFFPATKERQ